MLRLPVRPAGTGAAAQHCLLQLPGGGLCKVPADATPGHLVDAMTAGQPDDAAAVLASLLSQAGGLAHAPLRLLESHARACYCAMLSAAGGDDSLAGSDRGSAAGAASAWASESLDTATAFALATLAALPTTPRRQEREAAACWAALRSWCGRRSRRQRRERVA